MEERSCDVATMFCRAQREPLGGPTPSRLAAAHPGTSRREIAGGNCCCSTVVQHRCRRLGAQASGWAITPTATQAPTPPLSGRSGFDRRPSPTSSPSPPMRCDAFSQWECPLNGSCFSLLPCQLLLRCDGTSMTFSPLGPWGRDLWSQTNVH